MDKDPGWSPPYNVVFKTFNATLDKIAVDLPNRVDRTYLSSQAGSVQTYLIAAYRGFDLIREDGGTTEALVELAADEQERPKRIGELLRRYYANAMSLGESNATPGELEQVFAQDYPRLTGESRTKAIRFFLTALDYSGLPKSPLWKVAKASGTGRSRRTKSPRTVATVPTDSTPLVSKPKDMKQAYFDLLLKKAEDSDTVDADLLNRIERLLGVPDAATAPQTGEPAKD